MKQQIHIRVIENGRVIASGDISCEEEQHSVRWDAILFDYNELKREITPSQWIEITDRGLIPESHRQAFT